MKYGYMFYQKPLIPEMPCRPINLGDPIQSYAVKLLYREMGIKECDIIPVPRYDMRQYDGEECICVVNTCSTYEELAYDSFFSPPSKKLHAVLFSLHINREIPPDELEYYKGCIDVGCRDVYTENKLALLGVNSYLTGCLSLTFPRRTLEQNRKAKNIYLIDVQPDFKKLIPDYILKDAIELSNIYRFDIVHKSHRMTKKETFKYHRMGEERIELLRDTARLVITSRLHAAAPCLAMGIPVILTKHDDRFGFIDRFLPSYTDWSTDCIEWNPLPIDIEEEKSIIKKTFFNRISYEKDRIELTEMWNMKKTEKGLCYEPTTKAALKAVKFSDPHFKYAVLGIVSSESYFVPDIIQHLYPEAELVCGIDSYVKQDFFGKKTIKPNEISSLNTETIIITAVLGAYKAAERYLDGRPYVILDGNKAECFNFSAKSGG